jgi:DNA helicase-2/ATP-dependent DNA helicase PcrA
LQAAESQFDYLEMLNPAQREAATYGEPCTGQGFEAGPLLVIAGAGTGKTPTWLSRASTRSASCC